jgi:hypothetical protein
MSKFKLGEKAPKEIAEKSLRAHVAGVYDGKFDVKFESDDSGNMITLYVEVDVPSDPLDPFITEAVWAQKWEGWRYIIMKCPPGYIDACLNSTASDDW